MASGWSFFSGSVTGNVELDGSDYDFRPQESKEASPAKPENPVLLS